VRVASSASGAVSSSICGFDRCTGESFPLGWTRARSARLGTANQRQMNIKTTVPMQAWLGGFAALLLALIAGANSEIAMRRPPHEATINVFVMLIAIIIAVWTMYRSLLRAGSAGGRMDAP